MVGTTLLNSMDNSMAAYKTENGIGRNVVLRILCFIIQDSHLSVRQSWQWE